jgi:hypothetical protein
VLIDPRVVTSTWMSLASFVAAVKSIRLYRLPLSALSRSVTES